MSSRPVIRMEEDRGNDGAIRQDLSRDSSSTDLHHENHSSDQILVEMALHEKAKQPDDLKPPPLSLQLDQDQQHGQDRRLVHEKIHFHETNQQLLLLQEGPNQEEQGRQDRVERSFTNVSMAPPTMIEGKGELNENLEDQTRNGVDKAAVEEATEEARKQTTKKPDQQEPAATVFSKKPMKASLVVSPARASKADDSEISNANMKTATNQTTAIATAASTAKTTSTAVITMPTCKKVTKRPRAKPGFGLRTSRTTIVETGQKRRSCICTNSKQCNELMTKWAKVSPPDYHYVQLPREHNPLPSADHLSMGAGSQQTAGAAIGKTNGTTISSPSGPSTIPGNNNIHHNNINNTNMSDTDIYKNGFRYATLRNIQAKNPLPKDERVALCHYHPEVRPYLFWPKNTPSAQKYAIPMSLALQLGQDTITNKCQGFNTEKFCYAIPTYNFEDAKAEIGSVEESFYDRVRQIKTNPTKFVRDLRQCEEELKEVHKLRRRNTELLRRLDDRRGSIKRLRSVLKVQRHATKEAQQQLTAQAASVNAQGHAVSNNHTAQQQYQQSAYQTTAFHHQQQMADPSQQQQQATTIPQPLGHQNHNQFFQPPPPTQEQQAIGIVVGGITQNNEQQNQQHEPQHHWAFTQYNSNAIGGPSGSENEQQHSQQQVQLTSVHPYDPTQQQQQPVPSPMDDQNNPGNSFSYAQQLEAAMAAAVAAGFKDDQEDDDQQQNHDHDGDLVDDVVDLDGLDHHDGFDGDHGDDDELEDDDWSDTEQYRQSTGGCVSQNQQRPRKWPRKTIVLPYVSSEVEVVPKKVKRNNKSTSGSYKKRTKTTKSITSKTKKSDTASGIMVQSDHLLSSLKENHKVPNKIRKT